MWINTNGQVSATKPTRIRLADHTTLTNEEVTDVLIAQAGWAEIADPEPVPQYIITPLAFRMRFTAEEKIRIEIAALDDVLANSTERNNAASLRSYLQDIATASFIDLQRADTRAGVNALEQLGLISTGRAAAILDTPAEPHEIPQ